jgi:cardiolipin synthase
MRLAYIPNLITLGRIALVGPIVWYLLGEDYATAFLLFLVAGASDALDGQLAKRLGWESRLGGLLDPAADKLLLVAGFLCLGWLDALPGWLVALVILRDLVIVAGAATYHWRVAPLEADPMFISKVNTVLQIALVLVGIAGRAWAAVPPVLSEVLIVAVAATTVASGAAYVVEWSRRAVDPQRRG